MFRLSLTTFAAFGLLSVGLVVPAVLVAASGCIWCAWRERLEEEDRPADRPGAGPGPRAAARPRSADPRRNGRGGSQHPLLED